MRDERGVFGPDPMSVLWEPAAAALLERVYAVRRDVWVGTRLSDPQARHVAAAARLGMSDPRGPDPVPGRRARTAWVRSFVRAIERENKRRRRVPLQFEVGRHKPGVGVVPAGTAFRVRARKGGQAADRAVQRMDPRRRIYNKDGSRGPQAADLAWRDWG